MTGSIRQAADSCLQGSLTAIYCSFLSHSHGVAKYDRCFGRFACIKHLSWCPICNFCLFVTHDLKATLLTSRMMSFLLFLELAENATSRKTTGSSRRQ